MNTDTPAAPLTPRQWFSFTLGFADDGPDLDTVRLTFGLPPGCVIHVTPANGTPCDVVFSRMEQEDDPYNGFPVYIVGNLYDDDAQWGPGSEPRGAAVRIPLAGAHITVY